MINIYLPYQLVQMGRIKHLLDRKTLLLLINSFVFSKRFYCSSLWGNTSKRNLHKLQLVQNFAARVVLGLRKFDHISQGRRCLRWLDVTEKVLFNDLVLVFKCLNGLAPDYFTYVQKCMQWRNWRKITSRWRFWRNWRFWQKSPEGWRYVAKYSNWMPKVAPSK